tara:strand:+ start:75 stop:269 length:195 start_codon:yes stop_codon:yes gene_type:complete
MVSQYLRPYIWDAPIRDISKLVLPDRGLAVINRLKAWGMRGYGAESGFGLGFLTSRIGSDIYNI